MSAIKSQHSRLLEKLVGTYRQSIVESVINGVNPEFYRELIGEIRGLDAALKMSEEADFKLSGDFDVHGA